MARFFIDRPVFAWVISLMITLVGLLAIRALPVAQYPDIAPPMVSVYSSYPGASAKVVEDSVTAIIERQMNGAPGLMYTSATSGNGESSVNLTFRQGTSLDLAAVEVQNRLKTVESRLPEVVRRYGVKVERAADNIHMVVTLSSRNPAIGEFDLGELAASQVVNQLKRVPGVGQVQFWGTEKAIRIWPDATRLVALDLTASDIVSKVRAYNARVTVGDLGAGSTPTSAPINANVVSDTTYSTPEQFASIPLRVRADGSAIRLGDVARVELGASDYNYSSRVDGLPATAMGIKLAAGSNAVEVMKAVRAVMDEQAKLFPAGVEYQMPYETASFVKVSIQKVVKTLLEAIVLVFIVMYLFMQNLRATLIPTLVVPVALLGTFGVLLGLGYSVNTLTMFGMVLAIGILVDDAIVVVENTERIMVEEGLSPYAATVKAMKQISGAIIGITVVLVMVFIPMAFFSGAVGNIYRQFAVTLAVSISFSAFLALSLTPALCATLLRPVAHDHHEKRGFFGWFNRTFAMGTERYTRRVDKTLRHPWRSMLVYGAILIAVPLAFVRLPSAFVPEEDTGSFMVMASEPQGATLPEAMTALKRIESYLMQNEPVKHVFVLGGWNEFGAGPGGGMLYVTLKDWHERTSKHDGVNAIVERVNAKFTGQPDRMMIAMNSPALPELGSSNGFNLRLQDRAGVGAEVFTAARDELLQKAAKDPVLKNVIFAGQGEVPQIDIAIDRRKMEALKVGMDDVNTTLATMFGSEYVGDFMLGAENRRVVVQSDGRQRVSPEDIGNLRVRNASGEMVPLSSFVTLKWKLGSPQLKRYNGYPSFTLQGESAPGKSSGEAMARMEQLMSEMPAGIGHEWSGQSLEERASGAQAPILFALSVLVVFLALAALYESWAIPAAVIMVVPLGVIGALGAVSLMGMPNDIYFKVGLIATIGLSAKNAILIAEVANDLAKQGMTWFDAAVEAARLRLRPIVMTSLAFGFGVVPLAIATGPASGAQRAIGVAVLGGIVTATVLAIFLVPLFFLLVGRFVRRSHLGKDAPHHTHDGHDGHDAAPAVEGKV
ncbi:multidrug efflux RND transporter permease subunit [Pandoraea oxalativorans]|uniref:Efflux pump membrane transporter n=1 Tax=Pandoraea oxalativorans TaxID=573737 RepID=A0A0E3YE35_9BURK|nr:multidrug efflux RND transporter permease subunit [Pandoraea oxalativorans]AKC71760.1 multidrug efflux RND transporter permease [Pandoraea oxalativorans]